MNKQRRIINEKLNSIDHKLDVNELWSQLETQLPQEQPRKRLGLWLWGGLMTALLLGGLGWYSFTTTGLVDASAQTYTDQPLSGMQLSQVQGVASATKVSSAAKDTDAIQSQKGSTAAKELSKNRGEGTTSDIATSGKPSTNKRDAAAAEVDTEVGEELATNKKSYDTIARVGSSNITRDVAEKSIDDTEWSLPPAAESQSAPDLLKAIWQPTQERSTSPGAAEARANEHRSADARMVVTIAKLQQLIGQISFERKLPPAQKAMLPKPMIEPKRSPSKWMVGFVYNYGRSWGTATYGDIDQSVLTEGASEAARGAQQVDVLGGAFTIGYALPGRLGASIGLSYQRATDKIVRTEAIGTNIQSLTDGGYQISNQQHIATAYELSQVMDFQLGLNYQWQWGKFGIRPEAGLVLGLAHNRVTKSIDPSLELYRKDEGMVVKYTASSSAPKISNSYYTSLSASYDISSSISLTAGVRFMPSRTFAGDEAANLKYNSTLLGQAGLWYRF